MRFSHLGCLPKSPMARKKSLAKSVAGIPLAATRQGLGYKKFGDRRDSRGSSGQRKVAVPRRVGRDPWPAAGGNDSVAAEMRAKKGPLLGHSTAARRRLEGGQV